MNKERSKVIKKEINNTPGELDSYFVDGQMICDKREGCKELSLSLPLLVPSPSPSPFFPPFLALPFLARREREEEEGR